MEAAIDLLRLKRRDYSKIEMLIERFNFAKSPRTASVLVMEIRKKVYQYKQEYGEDYISSIGLKA